MNKIKEQLRLKMLGQLSDEKTKLDIDNAYSVVKKSVLSFSNFLGGNFKPTSQYGLWENNDIPKTYTLDEIYKMWNDDMD